MKFLTLYPSSLALSISKLMSVKLSFAKIIRFPNQETQIILSENYTGENIYIFYSFLENPNNSLFELILLLETIVNMRPRKIILVMPYMNYSRQDSNNCYKQSTAIRALAKILKTLSVDAVITVDIHSQEIINFFTIKFSNINHLSVFAEDIKKNHLNNLKDIVIVSADNGSIVRAKELSMMLKVPYSIITKQRLGLNRIQNAFIKGNVTNKICYLIDDIIDTGTTILSAASLLIKNNVKEVHCYATHSALSGGSIHKLSNSHLKSITFTNSTDIALAIKSDKIRIINIAEVLTDKIQSMEI